MIAILQVWGDTSLWFWVAFPWSLVMLGIFSCACQPSAFPLWKNVYSVRLPIFNWFFLILSCISCLYILDINSISVLSFENIFSRSVGCLFILLMVSFGVKKLVCLITSHLFIFALVSFVLADESKESPVRAAMGIRVPGTFPTERH